MPTVGGLIWIHLSAPDVTKHGTRTAQVDVARYRWVTIAQMDLSDFWRPLPRFPVSAFPPTHRECSPSAPPRQGQRFCASLLLASASCVLASDGSYLWMLSGLQPIIQMSICFIRIWMHFNHKVVFPIHPRASYCIQRPPQNYLNSPKWVLWWMGALSSYHNYI